MISKAVDPCSRNYRLTLGRFSLVRYRMSFDWRSEVQAKDEELDVEYKRSWDT